MIIHGGRGWTDYRVETALTVHLAQYAGVAVRVQGLRRYYAAVLVRPGLLRLVRAYDDSVVTLAETAFDWTFERPYAFVLEAEGDSIAVAVGGTKLRICDESALALRDGGIALIIDGGACSCDEVRVKAPGSPAAGAAGGEAATAP